SLERVLRVLVELGEEHVLAWDQRQTHVVPPSLDTKRPRRWRGPHSGTLRTLTSGDFAPDRCDRTRGHQDAEGDEDPDVAQHDRVADRGALDHHCLER